MSNAPFAAISGFLSAKPAFRSEALGRVDELGTARRDAVVVKDSGLFKRRIEKCLCFREVYLYELNSFEEGLSISVRVYVFQYQSLDVFLATPSNEVVFLQLP